MKLLKKGKKALIITLTAAVLSGSLATPVLAHGHGGGHHVSTGVSASHHESSHHFSGVSAKKSAKGYYCAYHDKTHKKKSNCKKYCTKHHKTHKNGKKHKCV